MAQWCGGDQYSFYAVVLPPYVCNAMVYFFSCVLLQFESSAENFQAFSIHVGPREACSESWACSEVGGLVSVQLEPDVGQSRSEISKHALDRVRMWA